MPTDQLSADVDFLTSQPGWQAEPTRRDYIRSVAAKSLQDDTLDPVHHSAVIGELWKRADTRGPIRQTADFVAEGTKEILKSFPSMGGAAVMAGADALGFSDSGSGTRLKRGIVGLADATVQRTKRAFGGEIIDAETPIIGGIGRKLADVVPGQSRQGDRDAALSALKTDLDARAYPDGLEAWLAGHYEGSAEKPDADTQQWIDGLTKGLAKKAVAADYAGPVSDLRVRDWLESDRNPSYAGDAEFGPGPKALLADYLVTRDPSSWEAFTARVKETDAQRTTRLRRYANEAELRQSTGAMPEGLMKDLTVRSADFQTSPIDILTTAVPFLKGAKAFQAAKAGVRGTALYESGKGVLMEAGSEGLTTALSDPNASTSQILHDAGLGAVGAGALTGTATVAGTLLKRPPSALRPPPSDAPPTTQVNPSPAPGSPASTLPQPPPVAAGGTLAEIAANEGASDADFAAAAAALPSVAPSPPLPFSPSPSLPQTASVTPAPVPAVTSPITDEGSSPSAGSFSEPQSGRAAEPQSLRTEAPTSAALNLDAMPFARQGGRREAAESPEVQRAADRAQIQALEEETGKPARRVDAHAENESGTVAARGLAGILGLRIVWFSSASNVSGMMDAPRRTIYLNTRQPSQALPFIVGHEATHFMVREHPEIARQVIDALREMERGRKADLAKFHSWLKEKGYSTVEANEEEMLSHLTEFLMHRPEFFARMFAGRASLGRRFLEALREFFESVKAMLSSGKLTREDARAHPEINAFFSDEALGKMERALGKAFGDLSLKVRAEKGLAGRASPRTAKLPKAFMGEGSSTDAAYMEAVRTGNAAEHQKLADATAKQAGYDPTPLYHYGGEGITEFRSDVGNPADQGPAGTYLSPDPAKFAGFKRKGGGAYRLYAKITNPATLDTPLTRRMIEEAERQMGPRREGNMGDAWAKSLDIIRRNRAAFQEYAEAPWTPPIAMPGAKVTDEAIAKSKVSHEASKQRFKERVEVMDRLLDWKNQPLDAPLPVSLLSFLDQAYYGMGIMVGHGERLRGDGTAYRTSDKGMSLAEKSDLKRRARTFLESLGFDGVSKIGSPPQWSLIKGGHGDFGEVVAFRPHQIKSADPITYYKKDDPEVLSGAAKEGDPIPLGQRFNPESSSILYSDATGLILIADSLRILAREAKTLAEFTRRIVAKYGPKIRAHAAALWESLKDATGKAVMKYLEKIGAVKFLYMGEGGAPTSDFMRDSLATAKAMAAAGKTSAEIRAITGWFPGKYDGKMRFELPDSEARFIPATKTWKNGGKQWAANLDEVLDHPALFKSYPSARKIRVSRLATSNNKGSYANGKITLTALNGNLENFSTLLHEVQHWLQEKEGFARGSNAEMFSNEQTVIDAGVIANRRAAGMSATEAAAWFESKLGRRPTHEAMMLADEPQNLRRFMGGADASYRRTAGEIEARDVQARQSYTDAQRKATEPYSSENIAPEDAIVLHHAGGQSSASPPASKLPKALSPLHEAWWDDANESAVHGFLPAKDVMSVMATLQAAPAGSAWQKMAVNVQKALDAAEMHGVLTMDRLQFVTGGERLGGLGGALADYQAHQKALGMVRAFYGPDVSAAISTLRGAREFAADKGQLLGLRLDDFGQWGREHPEALTFGMLTEAGVEAHDIVLGSIYTTERVLDDLSKTGATLSVLQPFMLSGYVGYRTNIGGLFGIEPKYQGVSLGLLSHLAMTAYNMGADTVETLGGGKSGDMTGFKTWPSMGFEWKVTPAAARKLARKLDGVPGLEDLAEALGQVKKTFSSLEMFDWKAFRGWHSKNGRQREMSFGVRPGSKSWVALRDISAKVTSWKSKKSGKGNPLLTTLTTFWNSPKASVFLSPNTTMPSRVLPEPQSSTDQPTTSASSPTWRSEEEGGAGVLPKALGQGVDDPIERARDVAVMPRAPSAESGQRPLKSEFEAAPQDYAEQPVEDMKARAETIVSIIGNLDEMARLLASEDGVRELGLVPALQEYVQAEATAQALRAVESAPNEVDRILRTRTLDKLTALVSVTGTESGQHQAARRYAYENLRPVLAVDEAIKKQQATTLDRALPVDEVAKVIETKAVEAGPVATETLIEALDAVVTPPSAEELARIKELEERIRKLTEQSAEDTRAFASTTGTWAKILGVFTSAGTRKARILTGITAGLKAQREAAKARIAKRRSEGRVNALPVEDFADSAIVGAAFLAEGVVEFTNWSQAMVRELGAHISPWLSRLYDASSKQFLADLEAAKDLRDHSARTREKLLAQDSPSLAKLLNSLRAKIAPGMKWREVFTSQATTQRQWELDVYHSIRQHQALQGLTHAEAVSLSREMSKAWQRERRKVWNRELTKQLTKIGALKPKARAKVMNSTPRLLQLINLGAFDSAAFRDAVAQEWGIKNLASPEAKRLKALAAQMQTAPEGLPRRKLAQQFIEGLQDLTKLTKAEILENFWTASVLSGWRTHTDILLGALNGMEDVGLGSLVTAARTGNKDVAFRAIGRMLANLPTAMQEALHHLVTGDRSMMRNYDAEVKSALEDGHKMMQNAGRQLIAKGGLAKAPGAFMELIGRMLTAWDHVNSTSTFEGAKMMALAEHPALYQAALQIGPRERANAQAQARAELTAGAAPANYTERLQERARAKEILDAGVPTEIIAQATEIGRDAALQGDPTGIGWAAMAAVRYITGTIPDMSIKALQESGKDTRMLIGAIRRASTYARILTGTKFARTVAHSVNRTLSYAPGLGLVRFAEGGMKGAKADILVAKQLLGTAVGLVLLAMFRGKDDDEEGIEGSWEGLTPQQRSQLYSEGKQPKTVWVRNKAGKIVSFNYNQWGLAGILSTVGGMEDQRRYHGHNKSDLTVLANGLTAGMMAWSEKAQLQGLQTIWGGSAYSSGDIADSLASRLNRYAAQTVGGLVPRIFKDVDAVISPELHSSTEWWAKWAAQVPMVRELSTGVRVDIFGADIKLDRTPLSRVVLVGTGAPEYRTLGRLNERDVWLPDPSTGVRAVKLPDGTRRKMSAQEMNRYQRATGAGYKTFILTEGERLLAMPDDQAREVISKRTKVIRDQAAYQATH